MALTGTQLRGHSAPRSPRVAGRGRRRALLAAIWLGAAAAITALVLHHLETMPHGRGWNDSYVYLGSASDFINHPDHLYDAARRQLSRPWPQKAFLYPPSGLLPFLPLVPIVRVNGIAVAAAIWSLIDTSALFGGLVIIGRRLGISWSLLGLACVLLAFTTPMRWEVGSGQVNGVILLLLALSMLRLPGRWSGVLLGLAVAIKPVAAIMLLVPLLRRRPAVTLLALLTFSVLNLVFVPFIGVARTAFYLGSVLTFLLAYVIHDPSNISLPNVLQTSLGGGALPRHAAFTARVPRGAGALAVLWTTRAAVLLVWLRACLDRAIDPMRALCFSLATVPLLTATVWPHYLLFAAPLSLLAIAERQLWARAAGFAALAAMLWGGRSDGLWISLILLWPAATVILFRRIPWMPLRMPWQAAPARVASDA